MSDSLVSRALPSGSGPSFVSGKLALAVAAALALVGCDGRSPFRSVEQRITEAFPVSAEVGKARMRLGGFLGAAGGEELFQAEFATRLRLRALACAQGNEPSKFDAVEKIRQRLPAECFTKVDAELLAWLQQRILAQLLTEPALRPIPEKPANFLTAETSLIGMRFASEAGVMLVGSGRNIEIIDVGTNKTIYSGDTGDGINTRLADISPNGRVIHSGSSHAGVSLLEAETGEVLAGWPDYKQFIFLGSMAALVAEGSGRRGLLDLRDGSVRPVKGIGAVSRVFPVPDEPGQFVISGGGKFQLVKLQRMDTGLELVLLNERRGGDSWQLNPDNRSFDGRYLYSVESNQVWRLELKTLQSEQLPIEGWLVMSATPMPDPDKLLLRIRVSMEGDSRRSVVYSIREQSYMPLDQGDFSATESRYAVTAVPVLGRIGWVDGQSMRLATDPGRGLRYSAGSFKVYMAEQSLVWQQHLDQFNASVRGYPGPDRVAARNAQPKSPYDSALAAAAADARIEAVGVYEPQLQRTGREPRAGPGSSGMGPAMPITVMVRPAHKPVVLVLSSYEAVQWQLVLSPGAQLKAVLICGYEQSTVHGMGSARVVNIGRIYAYERASDNYNRLASEVRGWTGKPLDAFQGSYRATSFMVGGR